MQRSKAWVGRGKGDVRDIPGKNEEKERGGNLKGHKMNDKENCRFHYTWTASFAWGLYVRDVN